METTDRAEVDIQLQGWFLYLAIFFLICCVYVYNGEKPLTRTDAPRMSRVT